MFAKLLEVEAVCIYVKLHEATMIVGRRSFPVDLGEVVKESLHVSGHGGQTGRMETGFVGGVADGDLLALGAGEAVAALHVLIAALLLPPGAVIGGEVEVVVSVLIGWVVE